MLATGHGQAWLAGRQTSPGRFRPNSAGRSVATRARAVTSCVRGQGTLFSVRWGTDEEGRLVPVDTREARHAPGRSVPALCPPGAAPGDVVEVEVEGVRMSVAVPDGVGPGDRFDVLVAQPDGPGPGLDRDAAGAGECGGGYAMTEAEVRARVLRLQTPLAVQVRPAAGQ